MKFLIALLLVAPISASAAPCKPDRSEHRVAPRPRPKPCAQASLLGQIAQGFELNAGFRWEATEEVQACPAIIRREPPSKVHDPFFIGAGFRLPLTPRAGIFVNGDRDFTDAPKWEARVGLSYAPFREGR